MSRNRKIVPFAAFRDMAGWKKASNCKKLIRDHSQEHGKVGGDILFIATLAGYEPYWLFVTSSELVYNLTEDTTARLLEFGRTFKPTIENRNQRLEYGKFLEILHCFDSGYLELQWLDEAHIGHRVPQPCPYPAASLVVLFANGRHLPLRYFTDHIETRLHHPILPDMVHAALRHVSRNYPSDWAKVREDSRKLDK